MPNDFLHLANQRFTFDPATDELHLTAHRIGGPSLDVGSFQRDYSIGTKGRGTNFDNCIVGYVCGEAEGFKHGIIHLIALNDTPQQAVEARLAVTAFIKIGASQRTILRGYNLSHPRMESTIGDHFTFSN